VKLVGGGETIIALDQIESVTVDADADGCVMFVVGGKELLACIAWADVRGLLKPFDFLPIGDLRYDHLETER